MKEGTILNQSFHMCVSPLLTRGVGISKKLHGQMRPSLIGCPNRIFQITTPKNSPLSWSPPWEALPPPISPFPCLHAVLCLIPQSCLTLCDSMDCSPPGSSVHGTLQASMLEWVAMPSSRGSSDAGIKLGSRLLCLQLGSLPIETPEKPSNID